MEAELPTLSILIPTVNPNERVIAIISELLLCKKDNFEIIVSLNAPGQELQLASRLLMDKRLIITTEKIRLNVAENWTKSVKKSSGKFLWLIGDDDFILNEQLTQVIEILVHQELDCLTFNAWSYIFPSKLTGNKALSRTHHFHYKKATVGRLTPNQREQIIKNMYRFVPLIPLNMQLTIFSRQTFEKIGDSFKMPFPDHIALLELLSVAQEWNIIDQRLCVVGMAPTSFGNSAYLNTDSIGESYLGLKNSGVTQVPGNILNSVMFSWLNTLSNTNPRFQMYSPSRGNYILRQLGVSYRRWRSREITTATFIRNLRGVQFLDLCLAVGALFSISNLALILKIIQRKPGPEKIIGAKFEEVSSLDISTYARSINLKVM